jgi:hypothetical protein
LIPVETDVWWILDAGVFGVELIGELSLMTGMNSKRKAMPVILEGK